MADDSGKERRLRSALTIWVLAQMFLIVPASLLLGWSQWVVVAVWIGALLQYGLGLRGIHWLIYTRTK